MTNEELERAVERLTFETDRAAKVHSISATCQITDLRALLSERAELLAAVERMRGVTNTLRERVAQIIEAAIERHNPGNSLRHTIDDADAILSLIQSERGDG